MRTREERRCEERKVWDEVVARHLVGRKVVKAYYLEEQLVNEYHLGEAPLVLQFDDGLELIVMRDEEGNGGGACWTNIEDVPVLPSL